MGRSLKFRSLILLSTLFVICVIAVTATWFGVRDFRNNLLREGALNDAIHWARFVASRSEELTGELESGKISNHTRTILDIAMGAGNVIKFDFYNAKGIIVYASHKHDIGHLHIKPEFTKHVVKGETFARIVEDEKFDEKIHVVSQAYVPVMFDNKFYGAIEVYVDVTEKTAALDKITGYVFLAVAALVISAALIWALFVAFDMKSRNRLEEALLEHRDQLQAMVEEATLELQIKAVELEKALSKQKELNELQRQFVSMASHEFRTPLAIIDGTAQRIKRKAERNNITPEDVGRRADKIRAAVDRMKRLMDSTLAAARMQEGKIQLEINSCNIGNIITEVCARHREFGETQDISHELIDPPITWFRMPLNIPEMAPALASRHLLKTAVLWFQYRIMALVLTKMTCPGSANGFSAPKPQPVQPVRVSVSIW